MDTQRTGASKAQPARQVTDDDNYIFQLAGSRTGPKTPQRQRGIWSFLVSPFLFSSMIALDVASSKGHARPGEEETDANGGSAGHSDKANGSPDDQAAAMARAADEGPTDQHWSSGYSTAAVRSADAAPEETRKFELARDQESPPSIAMPNGGGGGGGSDSSRGGDQDRSEFSDAGGSIGSSDDGTSGSISLTTPPIAITASLNTPLDGINIGITVEPILANLVPPVTLGASVDLGSLNLTPLNLEHIIGFDVHLNSDGSISAAAGLGDLLDPQISIPQTINAVLDTADKLPLIDISAPNVLDDLFGGAGKSSLPDLATVIGAPSDAITVGNIATPDVGAAAKLIGTLDAALPHAGPGAISSGTSDLTHVDITLDQPLASLLNQSSIVSPGKSIEFPTTTPVAGDELFSGHHYTDYHVALQTTGLAPDNSATLAVQSGVHQAVDAVVTADVDSPAGDGSSSSHPATSLAASQLDQPITQLSHALDELSLRGGGH